METLNSIISNPFIVLGISIGIGAWIGKKIKYKTFTLGLIAGSLFVSVILSAAIGKTMGVTYDIPDEVKSIFFGLFIFGIGVEAGSTFFKSLNKSTLIILTTTLVTSITGLALVIIFAYMFNIDKGLAAGLAAGSLTQSSIIGAASDALSKLNISPESIKTMQLNVAVGYSMTYIMGSFLPILLTTGIIPILKKWNLRKEAVDLAVEQSNGKVYLESGQFEAVSIFTTRVFEVADNSEFIGVNLKDLFVDHRPRIAVEALLRNNEEINVEKADICLKASDIVAIAAYTGAFKQIEQFIGKEIEKPANMTLVLEKRSVVVTNDKYHKKAVSEIDPAEFRNVFISEIKRHSENIPVDRDTVIHRGDELILLGKVNDLNAVNKELGILVSTKPDTDFTAFGCFLALGFLVGMITFKLFGVSITLGSGIGCLVSGILLGWLHTQKPLVAKVPQGAVNWLKDFGLAAFVAIVGLNAGLAALDVIKDHGPTIFILGMFVSTIPMIFAYFWMEYALRIKNPIAITAALNGARSSNPGFAAVLTSAGNATPIQYFTPNYTLAQITQTILGVIIVAIVPFVV